MSFKRKLEAKDVSLTIVFAALYAVLSFLPLFQIAGFFKFITVATIIAPIIGILLGAYLGLVSTSIGGTISLFVNQSFSLPSLAAGAVAALCSGLLHKGKKGFCVVIYLSLLIIFGFNPFIGAFLLYPLVTWFLIIGFIILVSPLQSYASKSFSSNSNSRLFFAFFVTSLTSTLASQIAGTLGFEILTPDANFWKETIWPITTVLYPIERTVIAAAAAVIGVLLYKALKLANIMPLDQTQNKQS